MASRATGIGSLDQLVERAVAGEGEALTTMLQRCGPAVRQSLRGQIPPYFQAVLTEDDVMQQTYTDAFLGIGELAHRTETAFSSWLTTIARRNLLDAVRMLRTPKRGGDCRHASPASDDSFLALYEMLGATSTTPSRVAARAEAREALLRAMESLPEVYRTVVQMYDLGNHAVEDVAKAVDRSPGAVFMLRARALRRLGELLGAASAFLTD